MGTQDNASNKVQHINGKVKETVDKVTGDEKLERNATAKKANAKSARHEGCRLASRAQ